VHLHTFKWINQLDAAVSYSSVEITNKIQPCNRIYNSTVHWRLNMFRAAHRSSSGALTVFADSGLHTHVVTGRSQVWVVTNYSRSPHAYVNQRLQIQLELLMMSGVSLKTCWAFNERWNNKFYYKVASCWLFFLSHTTMHGSMNIKINTMGMSHLKVTILLHVSALNPHWSIIRSAIVQNDH
jgi:hypothetical protein